MSLANGNLLFELKTRGKGVDILNARIFDTITKIPFQIPVELNLRFTSISSILLVPIQLKRLPYTTLRRQLNVCDAVPSDLDIASHRDSRLPVHSKSHPQNTHTYSVPNLYLPILQD